MASSALCFGKLPVKGNYAVRRFQHYLLSEAEPPSPRYSALERLSARLGIGQPEALFPMLANDFLADCCVVSFAHTLTACSGLAATPAVMPESQVIASYLLLTGGHDNGLAMTDVLDYGTMNSRLPGGGIHTYVSIDVRNHRHVCLALRMFGAICVGFQVPADCIEAFEQGMPWAPGLPTRAGHAVCAVGYDTGGLHVLSWGRLQRGTWSWWDECVDEAYGLVPALEGWAPQAAGFDLPQLQLDLNTRAGHTPGRRG